MNLPTISVVIPSLNQGKFLRHCLQSIFGQGYPNLEVVVMDGGSTDGSLEVIREFQSKLKYWKSQLDKGQAEAINRGMQECSGEIVAWLNADDWYLSEALWVVARAYLEHPDFGLYIGNGFREREGMFEPFCPRHVAVSRHILREGLDYVLQPSAFISKDAWLKSGGLDEDLHFGLDWDLFIRILDGYPAVAINEFLAVSREYPNTKTASGNMRRVMELIQIAKKYNNSEMTLGSSYYLLETMLALERKGFPDGGKHGAYRAIGQIKEEMQKRWGCNDSFPLENDLGDRTYLQIPQKQSIKPPITHRKLPKISIVIPSYNQAGYLSQALESVVNQDYPDLEILVMDGGSTDGSLHVIEQYADKLTYWQSQKDKGPADAINQGIRRGSGEIIGWLSSDDLLAENSLWMVAAQFAANPTTDIVYGNSLYIDENDNLLLVDHGYQKTALYYGKLPQVLDIPYYWTYIHAIPQPGVFFRREIIDKVGLLDTSFEFIFDFEFFRRVRNIAEFTKIEKTLSFYRIHSQSKTFNWSNFLVELYRFSRPLWPRVGTKEYRRVLVHFLRYYFSNRLSTKRRLYYPLVLIVATLITLRLVNPETLANWLLEKLAFERYPAPLHGEPRAQPTYSIRETAKRYGVIFCGFFFPLHPGRSGGEIRDFHILLKLAEIADIEFFGLTNYPSDGRLDILGQHLRSLYDPASLRASLPEQIDYASFRIGVRTRFLRWLRNRGLPVWGPRYHLDAAVNITLNAVYVLQSLNRVLRDRRPDFFFVTPQLNPLPVQIQHLTDETRTILSSYDVEKVRVRRIATAQSNPLARKALKLESRRAETFERDTLAFFDGVIAVSELDKQTYVSEYGFDPARILVMENSVDTDYFSFAPRKQTGHPEIVFTGSFSYFPNDDAAKRLVKKIMPLVWKEFSDARVWIVGQQPGWRLRRLSDGRRVFVTGAVQDIRPYMDAATLACIPLRTGSGTKYKVLEGASLGVPIVCTPIALEGLTLKSDWVMLGDTDEEIAEAIIEVIRNPSSRHAAISAAAAHVRRFYSWDANLSKLDGWLGEIKSMPKRGRLVRFENFRMFRSSGASGSDNRVQSSTGVKA